MCMRVKAVNKNLIYEPGGITEFARNALNREVGCPHGCRYCYGPASFRVAREEWTTPRAKSDYLLNLLASVKDREKQNLPKHQVFLEYCGDFYADPTDTLTARTIRILHDSDYGVCVLTKHPMNALKDIMLFDPRIDCLGVSLSTFDETEIEYWEHDAPHPSTRSAALKEFYSAGIYTWISQEPIISPASSLDVIERTHAYVDHYKSGLMTTRGQSCRTATMTDRLIGMYTRLTLLRVVSPTDGLGTPSIRSGNLCLIHITHQRTNIGSVLCAILQEKK